jgi:hypothetical protein
MAFEICPVVSQTEKHKDHFIYIPPISFNPYAITAPQVDFVYSMLIWVGLTSDIATEILNLAEYWCIQSYNVKASFHMEAGTIEEDPEYSCLYLQTGPLGVGQSFDDYPSLKPQKVVFTVISSDKGYRYGGKKRGYYNNFSWFDTCIFREDEAFVPSLGNRRKDPMQVIPKASSSRRLRRAGMFRKRLRLGNNDLLLYSRKDPRILPRWLTRDKPDQIVGGFKLVKNGEKYGWMLQQNRMALEALFEHRIE